MIRTIVSAILAGPAILVALLLGLHNTRAATPGALGNLYVLPGSSPINDCRSPLTPCRTINGALSKAVSGDTIFIAAGTYTVTTGDEVIYLDKDLTLSGGWDATFTDQTSLSVIDGEGQRRGIQIWGASAFVLDHLHVRNGAAGDGAGIRYDTGMFSSLVMRDSLISDNVSQGFGGGLCFSYGDVLLERTAVYGNQAQRTGGIGVCSWTDFAGSVTLVNATVSENRAEQVGGLDADGMLGDGTILLYNSTVAYNTADRDSGGIGTAAALTMSNSIIGMNFVAETTGDCSGVGTVNSLGYNILLEPGSCQVIPSTGDLLYIDPQLYQLVVPGAYHPVRITSLAVDGGNPAGCMGPSASVLVADQIGVTRPLDGDKSGSAVCDIGAIELDPEHYIGHDEGFLPGILKAPDP